MGKGLSWLVVMHECMNKRALSQVRQPLDRIVSVQLKAGGRRKKREAAAICRLQTELGNMGGSVKVPATATIHSLITSATH